MMCVADGGGTLGRWEDAARGPLVTHIIVDSHGRVKK